jgi:ABC-type transporter Mla maintaining outer membrane lipid asymmetry ATPase subunit MlaF
VENSEKSSAATPLIEMIDAVVAPVQSRSEVEVSAINWRVLPESFWVVAGGFGSGKSDFLMTAAGLQRTESGIVKIFGHETFQLKEELLVEHRRRVGVVFSNGGRLFNRLTVAENVALPLRYHHNWAEADAENSVREILQLTDLVPFAHRVPSALSPTWQQRVALARALILRPEILLLDKPLAGMAARHQRWWLDFLVKLSEGSVFYGGKRIVIVATTENFQLWKDVARQFAVLRNNRWQEIGGRAELDASGELLQNEVWADES